MNNVSTLKSSMSDIIRALIDKVLLDVNVCLPAKITAYNPSTQYADVQIQLYQNVNGALVAYPPIPNVPVKHPRARGGATHIHMPLQVGDDVTLVFSQRSLDNWKTEGGMTDPQDPRKHHLTDAYALIGGSSMADAFEVDDPTAIEVTNGGSKLQVFSDGTFAIKNGTTELCSQVQALAEKLSTDTTDTFFGPMQLNGFETYAEIATKVQTLVNSANQGDEES
jgi:hypothetical protein